MSTRARPKILCIIDTVGKGGGAEQLLAGLIPKMRQQGANVELLALCDWPENHEDQLEGAGVPLHRFHLRSPRSFARALRNLRTLVRSGNYDVFWGHLYFGNFYAWLARMIAGKGSLATTLHSEAYSQSSAPKLAERISIEVERVVLSSADLRIGVSRAVQKEYREYLGLDEVGFIHNGIDWRQLDAVLGLNAFAARAKFGFSPDDFLAVTPSRYVVKKGHRVWLDALEILREVHDFHPKIFFCGVGPLQDAIMEDVARRGLAREVTVSSVVPHEQLVPLIAASQAVVLPSLREPFGIAAAEAMALGTPCVLTKVDGFLELTEGCDCAHMVPPDDADAIADAILRLRENPDQAAAMAARAKRHVRKSFGIETCARRWIEVLESLPAATPRG